jgi:probable rRNA maturation factor
MSDGQVDVLIDCASEVQADFDESLLENAARTALTVMRDREVEPPIDLAASLVEISILITNDAGIQRLNREYRGVDRPTDILSFSLVADDEGNVVALPVDTVQPLGDIVVSYDYAARQAVELGHPLNMELAWLVIHGTLQLVGYTHDTDADAVHMEALERSALQRLGFTVP